MTVCIPIILGLYFILLPKIDFDKPNNQILIWYGLDKDARKYIRIPLW